MNYELRPMRHEDLEYVVSQHRHHFPDGFFARLGPRFLAAYTCTYVGAPHARAYVARAEEGICGFVVGVTHPDAHRAYVLRNHGLHLAMTASAALALRPALAWWFLRTRASRYAKKLAPRPSGIKAQQPHHDENPPAVLAHIAVSQASRALGVGSALVDCFTADAAAAGCTRVSLVTETGEQGAAAFYDRLGWTPCGEISNAEGRPLQQYELALTKSRKTDRAPSYPPGGHR